VAEINATFTPVATEERLLMIDVRAYTETLSKSVTFYAE